MAPPGSSLFRRYKVNALPMSRAAPRPHQVAPESPERLLKPKMQMSHLSGVPALASSLRTDWPLPAGDSQTFRSHWCLAACVFGCALGHVPSRGGGGWECACRPDHKQDAQLTAALQRGVLGSRDHPGLQEKAGGGKRLVREARCGPGSPTCPGSGKAARVAATLPPPPRAPRTGLRSGPPGVCPPAGASTASPTLFQHIQAAAV